MKPQQFASANNLTHIFLPSHAYAMGKNATYISALFMLFIHTDSQFARAVRKKVGFLVPEENN